MKHQSYLIIEGVDLPLPNSYSIDFRDIEADTGRRNRSRYYSKRYYQK